MGFRDDNFTIPPLDWLEDPHSAMLDIPHKREPSNFQIPRTSLSSQSTKILEADKNTPDNHVPRDSRMIRLTGAHPFNAEAPLTTLYSDGFLTSPELFYVRNHGPVPIIEKRALEWEISIEGLVGNPTTLSLKQIISEFEQITAPITLVCAGNRRKEQNVVFKTKGFSWGPAAVSTALFTGPMMCSVLRQAKPLHNAKYVCMEGIDDLPNGHYATSVRLSLVMDASKGIMLAHKMNGEALRPDHGWPLRAVVPGQIGGRSVKWLKKIVLTETPSDNWYHINDNRVLPTMVSPEMAPPNSKWWHDERYAIYELNVNSAIVYPQHDEVWTSSISSYKIRGYAYSGGGRRITRVEISFDNAKSWKLTTIIYPEDSYRESEQDLYGGRTVSRNDTCFCWCFWSLNIQTQELEASDSILVRAMDEAMNTQPRDMYWSVLGMMNNPWFRIVITKRDGMFKFKHPTQPGSTPGGWMEQVKESGRNLLDGNWGKATDHDIKATASPVIQEPSINMEKPGLDVSIITLEELKSHNKPEMAPWFVVEGEVYDGTSFLGQHPGGAQSILSAAATDVTDEFMSIHSQPAKAMLCDYHIGSLKNNSQQKHELNDIKNGTSEFDPMARRWFKATLDKKQAVSSDTYIFTFSLDYHGIQRLALSVGQHILLKVDQVPGSSKGSIIRSYTPISELEGQAKIDLLIKIYRNSAAFPGGAMSSLLDSLPLASTVDLKQSSSTRFKYLGRGKAVINGTQRFVRSFYMICAGSGITPIFQVLRAVMQNKSDTTTCIVLASNRSEDDILCRSELASFVSCDSQNKCRVIHTLTQPSTTWPGYKGRISGEFLIQHVVRSEGGMVLLCGPADFEARIRDMLIKQGWPESDLFVF